MRILGLDISARSAVGCLLCDKLANPLQYYLNHSDFPQFPASAEGIAAMLALKPDIAVLEPTGKYSFLWRKHLEKSGIQVWMVDHRQLRLYRQGWGTDEKSDSLDALALASYWFDNHHNPQRFSFIRHPLAANLRDAILQFGHISRLQTPIVNNLRQELSWQFPEAASIQSLPSDKEVALLWGWMAGQRLSPKYDRLYSQSCGFGLQPHARSMAAILCQIQRREIQLQQELKQLLAKTELAPYLKIFEEFRFGDRVAATLLSQIYPFEKFLGEDRRPIALVRPGKISGKPTTRHISERKFLKSLGLAPSREQSGTSVNKTKGAGGSALCRKALWLWVFTKIEPTRNRWDAEICQALAAELDRKKASKPVRLARSHVCARAAKILFRRLLTLE